MGVHPKFGCSGSMPNDRSVNVVAPVTNALPIKKRYLDDDYYHRKIQEYYMKKVDLFAGVVGLVTKEAKKKRPCSSTDHEDGKKKRKLPKISEVVKNDVTEELKRFITDEMNGLDVKVVIQKKLYRSDLKEDQNRLNMPIMQLLTQDFLTTEEKKDLKDEKNIMVRLVGPKLQMYDEPMVLRAWSMKKTKNYVLKTNWNSFVKDNMEYLKENAKIQVWSFRKDKELCFALVVVDRPDVVKEVV